MSSEPKVGPESDTDSMAEYGEGDTGKNLQFSMCCGFCFDCFFFFFYLFRGYERRWFVYWPIRSQ